MGDRANIFITNNPENKVDGIYLYTHWSGSRWPEALRAALEHGEGRWDDSAYITRIVASQVFADIHDDLTGGGISLEITDNEHEIIILDTHFGQVAFAREGDEKDRNKWYGNNSIKEFVDGGTAGYPADTKLVGTLDLGEEFGVIVCTECKDISVGATFPHKSENGHPIHSGVLGGGGGLTEAAPIIVDWDDSSYGANQEVL